MPLHCWVCFLGCLVWIIFSLSQPSVELWQSLSLNRDNYATSEQAQEVTLPDLPQQPIVHNAALRHLGGLSDRSLCHGEGKGRFHREGGVGAVVS